MIRSSITRSAAAAKIIHNVAPASPVIGLLKLWANEFMQNISSKDVIENIIIKIRFINNLLLEVILLIIYYKHLKININIILNAH